MLTDLVHKFIEGISVLNWHRKDGCTSEHEFSSARVSLWHSPRAAHSSCQWQHERMTRHTTSFDFSIRELHFKILNGSTRSDLSVIQFCSSAFSHICFDHTQPQRNSEGKTSHQMPTKVLRTRASRGGGACFSLATPSSWIPMIFGHQT